MICPACRQPNLSFWRLWLSPNYRQTCPDCHQTIGIQGFWLWTAGTLLGLAITITGLFWLHLPGPFIVSQFALGAVILVPVHLLAFRFARLRVVPCTSTFVWRQHLVGAFLGGAAVALVMSGLVIAVLWQNQGNSQTGSDNSPLPAISDDLDREALKRREISITGMLTRNHLHYIPLAIRALDHADSTARILILINSRGGNLAGTYAIMNEIQHAKARVDLLASGDCMSAAMILLLNGSGNRMAYPNTLFYFHSDQFFKFDGSVSDSLELHNYRTAHQRSRIPSAWFQTPTTKSFGALEAKRLGIIDSIL